MCCRMGSNELVSFLTLLIIPLGTRMLMRIRGLPCGLNLEAGDFQVPRLHWLHHFSPSFGTPTSTPNWLTVRTRTLHPLIFIFHTTHILSCNPSIFTNGCHLTQGLLILGNLYIPPWQLTLLHPHHYAAPIHGLKDVTRIINLSPQLVKPDDLHSHTWNDDI